jgi:hypothetical protein
LQSQVHQKLLERAAQACGGVAGVAMLLDVSRTEVAEWLGGRRPLPTNVFLKLVDYLTDDQPTWGKPEGPMKIVGRPAILLPVVREIAACALDEALALHGTGLGNVQLLNTRGNLEIAAQRGFSPPFLEFFREVNIADSSVCGQALALGTPVIVEDIQDDDRLAGTDARKVILAAGVRSVQSTPVLSANGQVFGMISTHFAQVGGAHAAMPSVEPIARRLAIRLQKWAPPGIHGPSEAKPSTRV